MIAGDQASPADVERIRQGLGLDRPFLVQFGDWLWHILHGDLGTSIFTNLPVSALIAQRIEPTLSLMVITLVLDHPGRGAARRGGGVEGGKLDRPHHHGVRRVRLLAAGLRGRLRACLRVRAAARMASGAGLHAARPKASGRGCENLILPALALGCVYIALIARITRASMLEVLQQDYIRTARAKGLGQRGILFVHALKNAAVPIVTVIGIGIALLIGGAVVTESVFAIPGLGRLTIDAILRRDYPVIQGIVLLFSFVYVLVNLMIDVIYTLVDPRIRY